MRIPILLVGVFISLSLFYYFNQKMKIKREQRRDRFEEKQEAILEMLRKQHAKGHEADETRAE
jgi:uncharacterized membrane protein